MDTALTLRVKFEKKEKLSNQEIDTLLEQSDLVKKLTKTTCENNLQYIFKIIGLAEIPFIERHPYTKSIISYINKYIATEEGFSYTGRIDGIVPCYNAMLFEAYVRMGLSDTKEAQAALQWIKKYQIFEREQHTTWTGKGIKLHGGCMNATPCYIGIGKSVRALQTYKEFSCSSDVDVERLITLGIKYMLQHNMFKKISNGKPISRHITEIAFPQSYLLTLTDLVYIASKSNTISNNNTKALIELVREKEIETNRWKIEYIYTYKGYTSFDSRRGTSSWVSSLFPLWIEEGTSDGII